MTGYILVMAMMVVALVAVFLALVAARPPDSPPAVPRQEVPALAGPDPEPEPVSPPVADRPIADESEAPDRG